MQIHWVKTFKLDEVAPIPVSDGFYRRIIVQTEKGENFELVLFSNNAKDLWVKP